MRCAKCSGITIQGLVELAQVEFEGCTVPCSSFYKHYRSIQDLEASAELGCDLCGLIVRAFSDAAPNPWEYPEEESLLAVLKGWEEPALINVAIHASHVYASATLDEVRNFDLLQIFARTSEEISPDDFDAMSLDYAAHLMLSTRRDCPIQLGEFGIGLFETDTDLSSDDNFSIARYWVDTCKSGHKECPSNDAPLLPTRVVDVGDKNDGDCRIVVDRCSTRAHYVALSHCWGGQIDCVLKNENIPEFQQRLPWDKLAANFQDAIMVTRKLGVRYLWVDCLCIVQDDYQDWAQESSKMRDIYRKSLFTIAAMSSPASGHGFIRNTAPSPTFMDKAIEIPLSEHDQCTVTVSPFRQPESDKRESFNTLSLRSPLSRRGWCLQESVLASRILFYGQERIYWKCLRGYQSADGAHAGRLFSATDLYSALSPVLFPEASQQDLPPPKPVLNIPVILEDYYWLLNSFTSRRLTRASDKLPAFSGLAQPIHLALGGQYLAGIFSVFIRSGLLWKKETDWATHVVPYRAPSWSWADTDHPVIFTYDSIEFVNDTSTFELLDSYMQLKSDENLYGEVISGHLLVRGLTIEIWRTREPITADLVWSAELGSAYWDEPMVGGEKTRESSLAKHIVELTEDEVSGQHRLAEMVDAEELRHLAQAHQFEEPEYAPPKRYTALLLHDGEATEDDGGENTGCLILEQVGREEVDIYRRVGLLDLTPHLLVISPQDWTRECLKII